MSEAENSTTHWSATVWIIAFGGFALFALLHLNRFSVGGAFPPEIHLTATVTFFLIAGTCLSHLEVAHFSWKTELWSFVMFLCAFAQGFVFTFCVGAPFEELERVELHFVIATGVMSALAFSCALWFHLRWKNR